MNKPTKFVSLHNHSSLGSPLDGFNSIEDLFTGSSEAGHRGFALTDHGSMSALYDAGKIAKKTNTKIVVGNEMYFTEILDSENKKNYHLVLLAQNEIGYRNLLKLNFEAFQNQSSGYMGKMTPRISWENIEKYNQGIFALTACSNGLISKTLISDQEVEKAEQIIKRLHSIFQDRFFLEIQPHALVHVNEKSGKEVNQIKLNEALLKYSHDFNIPYVITCDSHYRNKEMAITHDIMLAIKDKKPVNDPERFRYGVQDMYFKTEDELISFFGEKVALKGIENASRIFEACEVPSYLESKGPILPKFPVQDQPDYLSFRQWFEKQDSIDEDKAYLRYQCIQGFKEKCIDFSPEKKKEYWDRAKRELSVLEMRNFSSYILIVADYFNWAKKMGIPTGTGRGSVGGALVAYLTGIIKIDPIKHNLLFERFHNREKKAYPDIDLDFSKARRKEVQNYLKNKYGHDKVASISNWNTLASKVVIKDLAKSLNIGGDVSSSFKLANEITSSMPDNTEIADALKQSKTFAGYMEKYPELKKYALQLEGLVRDWGTHAAGLVLSDQPLENLVPLRIDKENNVVLQWEKSRTEDFGLVKMDILGLETLDVIDNTIKLIKKHQNIDINIDEIPTDDQQVFDMIGRGETLGVFQLESSLTPLCIKIKPKNIDEISDINALGRPSCPAEQRQKFIDRKFGIEKITYLHPNLKNSLDRTFGISLYEESMMMLAKDCAGWDLNQSDALRKITKLKGKDPGLVERTRTNFINDSMKHSNMSHKIASEIWEQEISSFSGYGFNSAHAVAYSYISYQTAWLKYYFPAEFLCALINSKDPNTDKPSEYIQECARLNIKITPPNINLSKNDYTISGKNEIATGLAAIKGLGDKALEELISKQPFEDYKDFLYRTNSRVVNKKIIQSLAKAGAFDVLNITRKEAHDNYALYRKKINSELEKGKLFENIILPAYQEDEWSRKDLLLAEREILGRTISGSLHEIFQGFFRNNSNITTLNKIQDLLDGDKIKVELIVRCLAKELVIKKGKSKGRKFAKYSVEDINGTVVELTVWQDHYEKYAHLLKDGWPIRAIAEVSSYMEQKTLVLKTLEAVLGKEL